MFKVLCRILWRFIVRRAGKFQQDLLKIKHFKECLFLLSKFGQAKQNIGPVAVVLSLFNYIFKLLGSYGTGHRHEVLMEF